MPRTHSGRYKLTWLEGTKRWRKRYKGETIYFPAPEGKIASYARCLKDWKREKKRIDGLSDDPADRWKTLIQLAKDEQKELEKNDTPENRHRWQMLQGLMLNYHRAYIEGLPYEEEMGESPLISFSGPEPPPWKTEEVAIPDETIEGNVRDFLEEKLRAASDKEISQGRYDNIREALETFRNHVGGHLDINRINAGMLDDYRKHLLTRTKNEHNGKRPISKAYARDQLASVKRFVQWCFKQERLESLPRNLDELKIKQTEQNGIEIYTHKELATLLKSSPEKVKLFLLLMLNTGMTQADIASLKPSEVNWTKGRIKRKRTKTEGHNSVPTVEYVLWKETFRLLKKYRSQDKQFVLTNSRGGKLLTETIHEGKRRKSDNIRTEFARVVRDLKWPRTKSLKHLRKTAASKLGEHPEYSRFAQHFLGHSPRTVADKHYVKPSQEQFDAAIAWLGEQFIHREKSARTKKARITQ